MSTPEPQPDRLDALLDGRAQPETEEERMLMALASELRESELELPARLDRRIDDLLEEAGPAPAATPRRAPAARRRTWWRDWRRSLLVAGPAAVAAASVLVVVVQAGGPVWQRSPELAPAGAAGSDAATVMAAPAPTLDPGAPAATGPPEAAPSTPRAADPPASATPSTTPATPSTAPAAPDVRTPTAPATVTPPPPAPSVRTTPVITAVVRAEGRTLRLRTGPGGGFGEAGVLPDGAEVTVECAVTGTPVLGPDGVTTRWLRLQPGVFASRAFLVPALPRGTRAVPDC